MQVNIATKEEIKEEKIGQDKRTIFGKLKPATVYKREVHAVYLTITLTEEEKAIIQRYNLASTVVDKLAVEDDPDRVAQYNARVDMFNKTTDPAMRQLDQEAMDELRKPVPYTMGQFLATPYIRYFTKPIDASLYTTRLKEKILPTIKNFITANTPKSSNETLNF